MLNIKKPYLLYLGNAAKPLAIKTARGIVDWRPEFCIGEYKCRDKKLSLGLKQLTPKEAKAKGAQTFVIGLANSGGEISQAWIPHILLALEAGLDIASGLHQKISDIEEVRYTAQTHNCHIHNVRHYEGNIPIGNGIKRNGNRILTVGTDCAVGKMYTALAIEQEMKKQGFDVSFKATGQSGLLLADGGICIDAVIADFMSGAVEIISPNADDTHWDIIEGQGSLFNPSFAGVSTGLLHGAQADYLVMCHEEGRENIKDLKGYKLPSLKDCIQANLDVGRLTNPNVKLVGISLNCRNIGKERGMLRIKQIEEEFGVPCFDPMITGAGNLVKTL